MNAYQCADCRRFYYEGHTSDCVIGQREAASRRAIHQAELDAENYRLQARRAQGLPDHERCHCLNCVTWRANYSNIDRMVLA